MSMTNISGLPENIYNASKQKTYSGNDKKGYSVTEILRSPTEIVLKNRHKDESIKDVKDVASTMIGTAVHSLLELGNTPEAMYDIMDMFKNMMWEMFTSNTTYKESFRDMVKSFYKNVAGSELLDLLEKNKAEKGNVLLEQRFEIEVDGEYLSGGIDYLDLDNKIMMDYKNTSTGSLTGQSSEDIINKYTLQLNMYRYMIYKNMNIDIENLSILFIFKDWSYMKYLADYEKTGGNPKYPPSSIYEMPISVLPFEVIEEYIKEKIKSIKLYESIEDRDMPPCSPQDRWLDPPTFALKKKTNTRNTRVSKYYKDIEKEKEKLIEKELDKLTKKLKEISPIMLEELREQAVQKINDEYEVNKIESKSKRCNRFYCDAYQFCEFGKKENPESPQNTNTHNQYEDLEL